MAEGAKLGGVGVFTAENAVGSAELWGALASFRRTGLKSDDKAVPYEVVWDSWWPLLCYSECHSDPTNANLSSYGIRANGNGNGSMSAAHGRALTLWDSSLGLYPHWRCKNFPDPESCANASVNGGVWQLAASNLSAHVAKLRKDINSASGCAQCGDYSLHPDFDGLGVLDWESLDFAWSRLKMGGWDASNDIRINKSIALVLADHPGMPLDQADVEAGKRWDSAARTFIEATLATLRELRPKGRFGFFGYPDCDGRHAAPGEPLGCSAPLRAMNDNDLHWLWSASSALFPSGYVAAPPGRYPHRNVTHRSIGNEVDATVAEAVRVASSAPVGQQPQIFLYGRAYFYDVTGPKGWSQNQSGLLQQRDLETTIARPAAHGINGVVLWGASADCESTPGGRTCTQKCEDQSTFLRSSLGPTSLKAVRHAAECAATNCPQGGRCVTIDAYGNDLDVPKCTGQVIKTDDSLSSVPPTLFWSSTAAGPGETVVIGKSGACPEPCECVLTPLGSGDGGSPIVVKPAQVNNASVMLTLPQSLPVGAFSVTAGGSAPLVVGRPDLWWVQGDSGNQSTSEFGWIRVFGRNIVLGSVEQHRPKDRLDASAVSAAISAAVQRGDFEAVERLAAAQSSAARQVLQRRSTSKAPTLILTDVATDAALPPIAARNSSSVEALFMLNSSVPPGTYRVSVSNGYATSKLDTFVSPAQPHVQTITVVSAASVAFDATVFAVESYGCTGGVNGTGEVGNESTSGFPVNCTQGVNAAISAAGAHGGGTVLFGPGRFYVDSPLRLPHGVLLKGAAMDLTAIYFSQDTSETEPGNHTAPYALIAPAKPPCAEHCVGLPDAPRFGLSDLAIYVLSYYRSVIDIRNDTVGVSVRRVRIRANAFHCSDWTSCRGSNCSSDGSPALPRSVPWEFQGGGTNPMFWIHGQNFVVEDCDLWSTWSVFHSTGITVPGGTPAALAAPPPIGGRFGLMRRNTIYNGGA